MTDESEADRIGELTQQVLEEQESNARSTSDQGPRDDDQADELAEESERDAEDAEDA